MREQSHERTAKTRATTEDRRRGEAAVAAALEEFRRAGRPVAVMREGRVVIALPEPRSSADALALREDPGTQY
jgi:hypothetical protein